MDGRCDNDMGSPGDSIMASSLSTLNDPVSSPDSDGSSPGSSKKIDTKKCGVCGDRALGYNFNAITCESCKAFFRRNALKNKNFRCPFNDTCSVDVVTRRFCQKCRLRKCFKIGMKKEWIMSDEEKQKKKQKIEENRARKIVETTSVSSPENVKSPTVSHSPVPSFFNNSYISSSDVSKPQAVVVGMVRTDEDSQCKVMKRENSVDVHSSNIQAVTESSTYNQQPNHDDEFTDKNTEDISIFPIDADDIDNRTADSSSISDTNNIFPSDFTKFSPLSSNCNLSVNSTNFVYSPLDIPFCTSSDTLTTSCSSVSKIICPEESSISNPELNAGVIHRSPRAFQSLLNDNALGVSSNSVEADIMDVSIKKEIEQDDSKQGERINISSQLAIQGGCATENIESPNVWKDFNVLESLNYIQPNPKENICSSDTTMMESIVNTAVSAEYAAFKLLSNCDSAELNEVEKRKLNELHEANKGLMAPLCEDDSFKDQLDPDLINVINMTEIAIRRFIKMSKRISAFKNLCQDDQIALLKGGCTEMMILRSVSAYDPDKDSWKIQQDHGRYKSIKLKVLKAASGNVYEEHKKFILAFQPCWRKDQNIMHLLSAITLFTPKRPNIVHPNAIRHEQSTYLLLLKRYLECNLGGCEGKTVYYSLLERIKDLHVLNENHVNIYMQVNTQEIAPLLIEIFDLKQR